MKKVNLGYGSILKNSWYLVSPKLLLIRSDELPDYCFNVVMSHRVQEDSSFQLLLYCSVDLVLC